MLMRKCLLAMLILMLLNLNTGYADTDADLCIRSMSLCCTYIITCILRKIFLPLLYTKFLILERYGRGDHSISSNLQLCKRPNRLSSGTALLRMVGTIMAKNGEKYLPLDFNSFFLQLEFTNIND